MSEDIINEINQELERLGALKLEDENDDENNEELPEVEIIKPFKKKRGMSPDKMREIGKIGREARKTKAEQKRELREKQEQILKIKQEKINIEFEEAQRLKEVLEIKKKKLLEEKEQKENDKKNPQKQIIKENKNLIRTSSRDILKEQYLMEAKRRVMEDLFS